MSDPGIAHLAKIRMLLYRDGIRSALGYLNSLAGHRYTAVHRLDTKAARALHFFDREHPWIEAGPEAPVNGTYCVFVVERRRPLAIRDALAERWLEGHPARETVRSYCGVPLAADDGTVSETLCHFDAAPRAPVEGTIELMQAVGALLPKH